MEKSTALCTNCHLEAHGGNPWDKGSENMRKALIILALLAVTSCASMTETKVDDCAESMAYAALVCSSDSLFGAGDCAKLSQTRKLPRSLARSRRKSPEKAQRGRKQVDHTLWYYGK
jgi:hypothetical protein